METNNNNVKVKKRKFAIDMNAPVILWLTIIALVVLLLDLLTPLDMQQLFGARRTSMLDPMQYVRLLTHVTAHSGFPHYVGNFMMILAIGPMVEEKYGSFRLALITLITAFITGLIHVIFFPSTVVGASGIVFMLILMASFTNIRQGKLPITVLLVAVLYIGNEIILGLFRTDNISRISHIVGGLCGAAFGVVYYLGKFKRRDIV